MEKLKKRINELIAQPLKEEGCEIADMVLSRFKNLHTLKLFVYAKDHSSLDECARISRFVGNLIDNTDLFDAGYTLEVSSPGLDRELTTYNDFAYRVGETVQIYFAESKKKKLKAEITGANENQIEFETEEGHIKLDLDSIEKAKIVF